MFKILTVICTLDVCKLCMNILVMPMEIFVSCVGDLATLGGPVVSVTPVRSPPGSFFSVRFWGLQSFYPGSSLA